MPSIDGLEVRRTSDGDVVIRADEEHLLEAEKGSVIVQRRDIPALIEMLRRELEGVTKEPEDSTTVRNLRAVS